MTKRKLPPVRDGREELPANVDVRPVPIAREYLVTKDGVVYSDTDPPLRIAYRDSRSRKEKGIIRRRVQLCVDGKVRDYYVAALVLEAWVGPRPDGMVCQQYDSDPLNCRLDNLFWGFPQTRVDPREFVKAWQSSVSVREVSERMGLSYAVATTTAKRMRDNGVPLIDLARKSLGEIDYAELAELAQSTAKE